MPVAKGYQPSEHVWTEIRHLDERLYHRGERLWDRKMPGVLLSTVKWRDPAERHITAWNGARFLGAISIGSTLSVMDYTQTEEGWHSGVVVHYNYSAGSGIAGLRRVIPCHMTQSNWFADEATLIAAEESQVLAEMRQSWLQQRESGLIAPSAETFDRLVEELRQGADNA